MKWKNEGIKSEWGNQNGKTVTIKIVAWNSQEYWQGIKLRNKYLKVSGGKQCIGTLPVEEQNDLHLIAELDSTVIGTLMLSEKNSDTLQVKQVVIAETYQGGGIGKELLFFAEELAKNLGYLSVFLTGRSQSWGFYEKFGYQGLAHPYYDGDILLKKYKKIVAIEAPKELLPA